MRSGNGSSTIVLVKGTRLELDLHWHEASIQKLKSYV